MRKEEKSHKSRKKKDTKEIKGTSKNSEVQGARTFLMTEGGNFEILQQRRTLGCMSNFPFTPKSPLWGLSKSSFFESFRQLADGVNEKKELFEKGKFNVYPNTCEAHELADKFAFLKVARA